MRKIAILPAAAIALLALDLTSASAQDACNNEYIACMTACASRPMKSGQDTCFTSCETKNGMCSERIYGRRPFNGGAQAATPVPAQAKDAMAKREREEVPQARAPEPAADAAPAPQRARR